MEAENLITTEQPAEIIQNPVKKWKQLLSSRKFWAAVVALVFVLITNWIPDFPLDQEVITNVIYLVISYILGTAIEDGLSQSGK